MMNFTTIKYDGVTVSLCWEDEINGATDHHKFSCSEPPTPAFRAALAAFRNYVMHVIDAPPSWHEDLEIRQLALSTEETGQRGLVVTALRKCKRARNRTVTINTPYLAEPPLDYEGDGDGFIDTITMQLVEEMEYQAQLYREGERGEQTTLDLGDQNIAQVNDRMAAAEVASTRKPKKPRAVHPHAGVPEIHQIVNPDAEREPPLDDAQLRQLLLTVERDVPVDAIAQWIRTERIEAETWARARQQEMMGGLVTETQLEEPACVVRAATLPLTAEQWTSDAPPPKAADVEPVRI